MSVRGRVNGDDILITCLAAGKSVHEAATKAGLSDRTAYRRLEQAEFRQRLTDTRARMIEVAASQLADTAGAACSKLKSLLEAESESVQLGAARTILEQTVRLRELLEIESRVRKLEERCALTQG